MSAPFVRFAPSPTGRLHVGNGRVAVVNWLFARQQGGRFLLRLDDTDAERSTAAFAAGIETDLAWLGLAWDSFARQSDRLAHYAAAAERLRASGRLYPCYETPEELGLKRKAQLAAGRPPRYDRAALRLSADERRALEAAGRRPHWRFRLEDRDVVWADLVRGEQHYAALHLSDPVLLREDGRPLYTLSSTVDDLELGITHVIRGEDHVANTAVQIELFEALGGPVPRFAHLPLLVDAGGAGLSKRLGSLSLESLREAGIEALTLVSYLAKLGSSDAIEARGSLAELAREFDLSHLGRAAPRFDPADLAALNAKLLRLLSFAAVAGRVPGLDEALWLAVRGNLATVGAAAEWVLVRDGPLAPLVEDAAFLAQAAALLPPEPWDGGTWKAWTEAVQAASGRKGRALFHPLRLALTAREQGPEMAALLPLIGRARAARRLAGETA
jgi:glutamyl-tRNA synthetase